MLVLMRCRVVESVELEREEWRVNHQKQAKLLQNALAERDQAREVLAHPMQ